MTNSLSASSYLVVGQFHGNFEEGFYIDAQRRNLFRKFGTSPSFGYDMGYFAGDGRVVGREGV